MGSGRHRSGRRWVHGVDTHLVHGQSSRIRFVVSVVCVDVMTTLDRNSVCCQLLIVARIEHFVPTHGDKHRVCHPTASLLRPRHQQ